MEELRIYRRPEVTCKETISASVLVDTKRRLIKLARQARATPSSYIRAVLERHVALAQQQRTE